MKCKKCDFENTETAKFCRNCGANLNEETEEVLVNNKKRVIFDIKKATLIILPVIVLATIFLLITIFSNNENKIVDALSEGKYGEAVNIYNDNSDKYDSDKLSDSLMKYLEEIKDSYNNGTIDYIKLEKQISTIEEMNISGMSNKITRYKQDITKLKESKEAFKNAEKLYSEEDYKSAIIEYKKVDSNDSNSKAANEKLSDCINKYRNESIDHAKNLAKKESYREALLTLTAALELLDNDENIQKKMNEITEECCNKAKEYIKSEEYSIAVDLYYSISDFFDTTTLIQDVYYKQGVKAYENGKLFKAFLFFADAESYKDSEEQCKKISSELRIKYSEKSRKTFAAMSVRAVAVKSDGSAISTNYRTQFSQGRYNVSEWTDIIAVDAGSSHHVGLKSDGTVVNVGERLDSKTMNNKSDDTSSWSDIVAVSCGSYHIVGLKSDGTVVAVGENSSGQCEVEGWTDIIAIDAGISHTVGLRADGTVVSVGNNYYGQRDTYDWENIIEIVCDDNITVGIVDDGTVVAVGENTSYQCDETINWSDIKQVSIGEDYIIGLRKDGTVVLAGDGGYTRSKVENWTDITYISAADWHMAGVKKDGTVVSTGYDYYDVHEVDDWRNIEYVIACSGTVYGFKKDGTFEISGDNSMFDGEKWTDIMVKNRS